MCDLVFTSLGSSLTSKKIVFSQFQQSIYIWVEFEWFSQPCSSPLLKLSTNYLKQVNNYPVQRCRTGEHFPSFCFFYPKQTTINLFLHEMICLKSLKPQKPNGENKNRKSGILFLIQEKVNLSSKKSLQITQNSSYIHDRITSSAFQRAKSEFKSKLAVNILENQNLVKIFILDQEWAVYMSE